MKQMNKRSLALLLLVIVSGFAVLVGCESSSKPTVDNGGQPRPEKLDKNVMIQSK